MEWYCHSKEHELETDPEFKVSQKYNNYILKIPIFKEVLKLTDTFLNKGLEKEKYLTKISREVKKKGAAKKKLKKESSIKDNAKAIGTLF